MTPWRQATRQPSPPRRYPRGAGVLHVEVCDVASGQVRTASVLRLGDNAPRPARPERGGGCSGADEVGGRQAGVALLRALQRTYWIR